MSKRTLDSNSDSENDAPTKRRQINHRESIRPADDIPSSDEDDSDVDMTHIPPTSIPAPAPAAASSSVPKIRSFIPSNETPQAKAAREARIAEAARLAQEKLDQEKAKKDAHEAKMRELDQRVAKAQRQKLEILKKQRMEIEEKSRVNRSTMSGDSDEIMPNACDEEDEDGDDADGDGDGYVDMENFHEPTHKPFARKKIKNFLLRRQVELPTAILPIGLPASSLPAAVQVKLQLNFDAFAPFFSQYVTVNVEHVWETLSDEQRDGLRKLLWRCAFYTADLDLANAAAVRFDWSIGDEQSVARGADRIQLVNAARETLREPRPQWTGSSQPSKSQPWHPTFDDLVAVLRAWGAELNHPTAQPEEKSTECSHEDIAAHASSSRLFSASPSSSPAPAASSSSSSGGRAVDPAVEYASGWVLERVLQSFAWTLLRFPHDRIFRSMCQRHDFLILLMQLMVACKEEHPSLHQLFTLTMREIETEVGGLDQIVDHQFFLLARLFLSPLIGASPAVLMTTMHRLRRGALSRTFAGQIAKSVAVAVVRSVADKQPLSPSLLPRHFTTSNLCDLIDGSTHLKSILPRLSKVPSKDVIDAFQVIVASDGIVIEDEPVTTGEAKAIVKLNGFLDLVKRQIGSGIQNPAVQRVRT